MRQDHSPRSLAPNDTEARWAARIGTGTASHVRSFTSRVLFSAAASAIAAAFLLTLLFALPAQAARPPRPALPALTQSGFAKPCGTATDSAGNLYIADYTQDKIKVISPDGTSITEFTPSTNGENVCSIAVDSAGNVYADGFFAELVKYKPSAFPPSSGITYAPDASIGSGSGVLVPASVGATSVAVNPEDDHVYVAEEGTHVSEYTPAGNKVIATIGEGLGSFFWGVDVSAETGNVYLTDLGSEKIYVLNPTGTEILAEFDGSASPDGKIEISFGSFPFPTVDQSDNDVLIPDVAVHGVVDEFTEDGDYVTTIANTPAFTNAGPSDVAVDNGASSPNKGSLYVSSGDGKVYAFGPLPPSHEPLPALTQSGFAKPCGTATDSVGDLYVADGTEKKVKIFGPDGSALTEFTTTANSEPCNLAVDSAGNVYVDTLFGELVKYKPAGAGFPVTSATTYAPDTAINGSGVLVDSSTGATSVAIDPSNDHVYVGEALERVGEYQPDGTKVTDTIGQGTVPGALYWGVGVYGKTGDVYLSDLASGKVYVLNPAGTEVLSEFDGSDSPDGAFEINFGTLTFLAVDQSSGNVLVPDIVAHGVVDEFDEDGKYITTISAEPPFTSAEPSDVAFDNGAESPNQGALYVSSGDGKVYAFGALPSTGVPLAVSKDGAGSGTVTSSPGGIDCGTSCKAKFTEGEEVTLTPLPDSGSRFKEWSGCTGVPANQCKVLIGENEANLTATFVPAIPTISALSASEVTDSSARLGATVNPDGAATSYQFEYLTEAAFEANGNGFSGPQPATAVPATPVPVGSGFADIAAAHQLSGLLTATTYRFRLRATNSSGPAASATGQFSTFLSQGIGLPDNRSYEQASPVDKSGGSLQALTGSTKASITGGAVTFESAAGIPGGTGSQEFPTYLATRKVDLATGEARWVTQGLLPPASSGDLAGVLGWSADFSNVFDFVRTYGTASDLLARSSADGSLTIVAHSAKATIDSTTRYSLAGTSTDGEVVVFSADDSLAADGPQPASGQDNLYAWDRDTGELRLASVLPSGSAPPGASIAGLFGSNGYTQDQPAVTSDGSIYFTTAGQLYLRENPTADETSQRDAEGNCIPDPALACTVRISASEKTNGSGSNGTDAGGMQPAEFMAAATNTSRAFFTSTEKLTDDATTGPEPALAVISRAKLGVSNPAVDDAFLPAHASGIADDGSHLYWADPLTGSIGRAKLNGDGAASEVEPAFLTVGGKPAWIAVDGTYVYWTDRGAEVESTDEGSIGRARLDKSEPPKPDFISGPNKVGRPQGIAVDAGHLYWATKFVVNGPSGEPVGGYIARVAIDGSEIESHWHFVGPPDETPQGVAVNGTHIFWSTNNPNGYISRAELDGSDEVFIPIGGSATELRGIAVDSGFVYWTSRGENAIGRANLDLTGAEPDFISGVEKSKGMALDGSHLYWAANGESLPSPGNDLYLYDREAPSGEHLTDITVDHHAGDLCPGPVSCGADVQGVLGASADGSSVYYVANGVPDGTIANSPNANGESAEPGDCGGPVTTMTGACNLYLWQQGEAGEQTTTFIARLDPSGGPRGDVLNWIQTLQGLTGSELEAQKTARVSSDGQTLLFRSKRSLTDYESEGQPELYRFDARVSRTICVSCSPTAVTPRGPATLGTIVPPVGGAGIPSPVLSRNLSADGNRVFFETDDKLVAADINGDSGCRPWGSQTQQQLTRACQDVYEWEAKGTGSCASEAQDGGCLYLLSTGSGSEPAFFSDASASGDDVFFFTGEPLVGQDEDSLIDVYDARVGGGLPNQNQIPPLPCEGEGCKPGVHAQSPSESPATANFTGPGTSTPKRKPVHPCPKGKRRRRHGARSRCVRSHRHRRHNPNTKTNERASR